MKRLLITAALIILISGCSKGNNASVDTSTVAKVGDVKISRDDYIKELKSLPEWARSRFQSDEDKDKFLDSIIEKEVLYAEAKKNRLEQDKEFAAKLEDFKKMNLITILLEKEIRDKVKIDDAEAKKYYDDNLEKYRKDAGVRASHILVETEKDGNFILAKLKNGDDFGKLARKFSKDEGSAQNGGDLGFFSRGSMVPEFEDAAFKLKPGEVSGLVKTQFGYHIIKVTDKSEGTQLDFEQAKDVIKRQLLSEKQRTAYQSYVNGLKTNAKIVKNTDVVSKIELPWEQK
ncbi:MAG: peptidylprolyl isomerase [Nitrospirae bacterium]|nr:peptidylprolyl isomerase [Nitrospirota bacterium]